MQSNRTDGHRRRHPAGKTSTYDRLHFLKILGNLLQWLHSRMRVIVKKEWKNINQRRPYFL